MTVSANSSIRYSPILAIARWTMSVARWLTVQWYLHWLYPDLRDRGEIPENEVVDEIATKRRATAIDTYVLGWLVAEVVILAVLSLQPPPALLVFAQVLAVSRFVDMLRATINTTLLDQAFGRADDTVASRPRLVLLSLVNYVELILCFGIVYASHLEQLRGQAPLGVVHAVYFSILTQLTISFGDPTPIQWLRGVAALQGLCGLLLIALVIARMVGALSPFKAIGEK